MRALLIAMPGWDVRYPSHSLACVAGIMKSAGWACTVVDENIEMFRSVSAEDQAYWHEAREGHWHDASFIERFLKRYEACIRDRLRSLDEAADHHLVAFTVNIDTRQPSLFASRFFKESRPNRPVVFGGADCYPLEYNKQFLTHDRGPDLICQGEAELCLPQFLREFKITGDFRTSVRGFAYQDAGITIDTGVPDLPNLKKHFVLPDWSQFDLAKYEQPGDFGATFSRGCPNKCAFCAPRPSNNRYRKRSAEQVVDEIASAMKHAQRFADEPTVHFSDSLLNGDLEELERLCHEIGASGLGIRWRGFVRFDKGMSLALLSKLKRSGCTDLFWGLESASQRVITLMGKKFDLDLAKRIARDAGQVGIACHFSMIVGFPGETPEDVAASIAFMCQFRDRICFHGPYRLMIVPGSPLHEHPSRWGVGEGREDSWVSADLRNDRDVRLLRQFIARNALHNDSLSLHEIFGWEDVNPIDFNRSPVASDIAGILFELWRLAGTESIMIELLSTWKGDLIGETSSPQEIVYWHPAEIPRTHSLANWFRRDKNAPEQRSRIGTYLLEAVRGVRTTCDASKEVSAS